MRNIVLIYSFQLCRLSAIRAKMSINLIVAIFAICHIVVKMVIYDVFFNSRQRTGLCAGRALLFVQPGTEAQ